MSDPPLRLVIWGRWITSKNKTTINIYGGSSGRKHKCKIISAFLKRKNTEKELCGVHFENLNPSTHWTKGSDGQHGNLNMVM